MPKKGDLRPQKNLIGEKFGKLTVIEYAGIVFHGERAQHQWYCKCECGNYKLVESRILLSGHCKSCGCLSHKPHNPAHKHYLTDTPLYNVWKSMKGRCYTKTNTGYKNYGAKGIKVCDEWKNDYIEFYNWSLKNGYVPGSKRGEYTLDRIDVNGNYEPSNCRWVDMYVQANNKTNTVYHIVKGEKMTVRDAVTRYGISYTTLKGRMSLGWSLEDAIFLNHDNALKYTLDGETHTLHEWADIYGLKYITLYSRLNYRGWSLEKALKTPTDKRKGWRKNPK